MLTANIFTMLGGKNTWNSETSSLGFPLEDCNLQFFDIFEIGGHGSDWKGSRFPACYTLRILVGSALSFAAVHRLRRRQFLKIKCNFKQDLVVFNPT